MNKYQEALDFLCDNSKLTQFNIGQSQWASETLQELVDKATPKKVKRIDEVFNGRVDFHQEFCGNCGAELFEFEELKYCQDCGQALDWSEDE